MIKKKHRPKAIEFLSDDQNLFQAGFLKKKKGYKTKLYGHYALQKPLSTVSEYSIVKQGKIQIDLFDENLKKIKTILLSQGDFLIHFRGLHQITFLEDSQVFEIR